MNTSLTALRLVAFFLACWAPFTAFAQKALDAPTIPGKAHAHWHSGKTQKSGPELVALDVVGANDITFPSWAAVSAAGGFQISGSQSEGVRLLGRQPISNRFRIGVDLNFAPDGPEHQTVVYLYGFCELRYRLSRGELTFNVWQNSVTEPGKQVVSSVRIPVPAGIWTRVEAEIDDKFARISVGGKGPVTQLLGTFEYMPESAPVFVAFGGTDRAFKGSFDHLYFTDLR